MSLLSTFISTQLIKALEHEFVNHAPEIQQVIIQELQDFLAQGAAWIENKVNPQNENEKK